MIFRKTLFVMCAGLIASAAALISAPAATAATCAAGGSCALGDVGPGGGVVFITSATAGNSTGLFFEAAVNTWNGSAPDGVAQWCNVSNANISGLGSGIGTGSTNSTTLTTSCASTGSLNAAAYVTAKTIGGKSDWFLPSKDEMLALYDQRAFLTGSYANNQTDSDAARYLTSTQGTNVLNAMGVYMVGSTAPGTSGDFSKAFNFSVRPVRSFTSSIPSSSPSSPSTASSPTITFTIDWGLSVASAPGGLSGVQGSWTNLPNASQVIGQGDRSTATFLGLATTANFPVEIAHRQVTHGWGAYEIFGADGHLSAVFIPAGGWTLISANGSLYPIWSE